MSLLPSRSDIDPSTGGGPRIVEIGDDVAEEVLSSFSSQTIREF